MFANERRRAESNGRPTSVATEWWTEHGDEIAEFLEWKRRQLLPEGMQWHGLPEEDRSPFAVGASTVAVARDYERVQCQFLDYYIRKDYEAPNDGESKGETLDFCWGKLRSSAVAVEKVYGFTVNDAEALMLVNGMSDRPGTFFGDGVGRNVVQWAIMAIVTSDGYFDSNMYISGTGCDSNLSKVATQIRNWRGGAVGSLGLWVDTSAQVTSTYNVVLTAGCPELPCGVNRVPNSGASGEAEPFTNVIRISPDLCVKMGQFADLWLAQAHRLYWAFREGATLEPTGADSIEAQVARAGRYALSAILDVAQTMMHEIVHQAVGWDILDVDSFHCDLSCCPDRAASRFWACKASSFGCVRVSGSTADGLTTTGAYGRPTGVAQFSTLCDDATGAAVTTTIKLDDPGEPSQPNDWSITSETLPANCP